MSRHPHGDVCGGRFAADLLPIANAAEHPMLAVLLAEVAMAIEGAGTLTGKARTTYTAAIVALARGARSELDDEDIEAFRNRRLVPTHHRVAAAEVLVRFGREPHIPPARGLKRRPRLPIIRSRALQAVVGCGSALLSHGKDDEGRTLLRQAARALELADPAVRKLLGSDPADTTSFASATNRWSWACAVTAASDATIGGQETLERLAAAARFFSSVGHAVGAAEAYSKIAQIQHGTGDHDGAAKSARLALSFVEERFAVIADRQGPTRWHRIASRTRNVGLATAGDDEVGFFLSYDSRGDWLGNHQDVDERIRSSSVAFRALGMDPVREMRVDFEDMLRRVVDVLAAAGAGGPLVRELVKMERTDLTTVGGSPLWLAKALASLAAHHARSGSVPTAIAAAREAGELFLSLDRSEARDEANELLRTCLAALGDDWSKAVRFAAAFHDATVGTPQDPIEALRVRATSWNNLELAEELAAFTVEAARARSAVDGVSLVRSLYSWGVARDALRGGAGAPVFAEALGLAETLAKEDPVRHTAVLIHARIEAAGHEQRAGRDAAACAMPDGTWHEINELGVPRVNNADTLIELVDATVATQRDARAQVEVLVPAASRLLNLLSKRRGPQDRARRTLTDWAFDLHDLGAVGVAAELMTALTQLPSRVPVRLRVRLANALRSLGDLAGAKYWLADALRHAPDDVGAHHGSGWLHLDQGDPVSAHVAFTKAVDLEGRAWSYVLRGIASLRRGQLAESVEDLTVGAQRLPHNVIAAASLARAHRRLGAPNRALAVLSAVGPRGPVDDWWRYQMGLSLAEVEDRGEAAQFFTDACELGWLPAESVGPYRRCGDPNLGLYLLAAGRAGEAAHEFNRLASIGMTRALTRELVDDLAELAQAMPEHTESAGRYADVLMCR